MRPRDAEARSRSASSLELYFDLVFVIAVSVVASQLAGFEERGEVLVGVVRFAFVFVLICWAWVNFTWFASAFDTDDWLYRTMTILQMAGVLVLAAGIGPAMQRSDLRIATAGYVIMRLALVAQWFRASRDPSIRRTARRYAYAIGSLQVLWVARLLLPPTGAAVATAVLFAAELLVPAWAERAGTTSFHPQHIAERFGLFTLIVLGEGLLGAATSVFAALDRAESLVPSALTAAAALLIVSSMWWAYFSRDQTGRLRSFPSAFVFGYSHCLVFAAAAAVGAGLDVLVHDIAETGSFLSGRSSAFVGLPVLVFLLCTWALVLRHSLTTGENIAVLVLLAGIGLGSAVPWGVAAIAACSVGVVAVIERSGARQPASATE